MDLIKNRDTRTVRRKLAKEMYDSTIDLATEEHVQTVRLLDEGTVTYSDGSINFYIEKGTLADYYNNLSDDYEGTINLGHMAFAEYPKILGTWTKKDLHLVDIGDGRQALDVDLRLNYEISDVRDLALMPYDVAVSAEFSYEYDRENSEKLGFLCINKLFISDFAIVGDGGNVNSNGIKLKGGNKMEKEVEKLKDAVSKKIDLNTEPAEQEAVETPTETVEPAVETEPVEETEPATEDAPTQELSASAEVLDLMKKLVAQTEELNQKIEELKAENTTLKETLSAKNKETSEFYEQFKNLKLSLSNEKPAVPTPTKSNVLTNPIGE